MGCLQSREVAPTARRVRDDVSVVVQSDASVLQARSRALAAAADALNATRGLSWRNTYVRATLVSYGASCKVFTAEHRESNRAVAVKVITKVRWG